MMIPIGTQSTPYTGTFDGGGFQVEIEGLPSFQGEIKDWGLFGYIGAVGKIQDLNVYIDYFGDGRGGRQISQSGMLAAYNDGLLHFVNYPHEHKIAECCCHEHVNHELEHGKY